MELPKITQNKYVRIVAGTAIVAAGLTYIGLGLDLIPDTIPWIGYVDDALAVLVGTWTIAKLYQKKPKK